MTNLQVNCFYWNSSPAESSEDGQVLKIKSIQEDVAIFLSRMMKLMSVKRVNIFIIIWSEDMRRASIFHVHGFLSCNPT